MYQVKITATCSKCGKQSNMQNIATDLKMLLNHMLFKLKNAGEFDGIESICIDC